MLERKPTYHPQATPPTPAAPATAAHAGRLLAAAALTGAATLGALALLGETGSEWLLVAALVGALHATVVLAYRPAIDGARPARAGRPWSAQAARHAHNPGGAPGRVVMPDTGFGRSGVIVGWARRPGERVEAGEPLATVEIDIAEFELFAPTSGTLTELLVEPGQPVAVGQPVAALAPPRR